MCVIACWHGAGNARAWWLSVVCGGGGDGDNS